MIRKRLMGLALSCAVFASSCYMSLVPAQAVVRDNVGGMDTSIDSGSTDKDGNTATEGSAGKDEILKGFGAWVDGELVVGTMPNNGSVNGTLDTSNTSYAIPKGYHDGSGTINVIPESKTVNSLSSDGTGTVAATSGKVLDSVKIEVGKSVADRTTLNAGETATISKGYVSDEITITANPLKNQTPGTATESKILANETAWVNGSKVTGCIPSKSAATITPNTKDQTISAGQYLSGTQTIKGDTNLVAGNILKGKNIFGVSGTVVAEANSAAHTVPTGKTAGSAANILSGKTAWNGTAWVDGTMVDKSDTTTAASSVKEDGTNAKIQIPASGFYNKDNSYITVPVETLKKEVSSLNSSSVYYLGTGTSFDVSNIPGYQNLTKDNFIVCACSLSGSGTGGYYFNSVTESTNFSMPTVTPTVTYSNGKLTITNTSTSGSAGGGSPSSFGRASASLSNIKVYLVIGDIKQP